MNTFNAWLKKIDDILWQRLGLTTADLPDCPYFEWFETHVTPRGAAARAIRAAKGAE